MKEFKKTNQQKVIDILANDLQVVDTFIVQPIDYDYAKKVLEAKGFKVIGIKSHMATSFKVKKESSTLISIESIV